MKVIDRFNYMPAFAAALLGAFDDEIEEQVKEAHDTMVENWEQGRDAQGRPWPPLAQATIERKGHSQPLIETQQMIESTEWEYDDGDHTGRITIADEKAIYHEYGVPEEGIPPRPMLGPTLGLLGENVDDSGEKAVRNAYRRAKGAGIVGRVVFG